MKKMMLTYMLALFALSVFAQSINVPIDYKNLSRGSMKQKWGALPIGVWLAMESKGDDSKLIERVNKGPDAVMPIAQKYLTGESKIKFEKHFNQ